MPYLALDTTRELTSDDRRGAMVAAVAMYVLQTFAGRPSPVANLARLFGLSDRSVPKTGEAKRE